ncbi:MAG: N-6 DNA methylase [Rhodocyclales bacterium]|nr:N-6 DNA methylase [Rhodocyclales bacterium]
MANESDRLRCLSGYGEFRAQVRQAFEETVREEDIDEKTIAHHLNGGASVALEKYLDRSIRSRFGIFFSGQALASCVAATVKEKIAAGATVADPTCGAGDLLLACLSAARLENGLGATLAAWSERTFGSDIHGELVKTARERLALLAATRLRHNNVPLQYDGNEGHSFQQVIEEDYLQAPEVTSGVDCVVMNPPFGEMDTPTGVAWSTGKVQKAAVFAAKAIEVAKDGQDLVAVLPDVLRSGTRYDRWRTHVARLADIKGIWIYGKFDAKTDVDVFVLHLRKRVTQLAGASIQWTPLEISSPTEEKQLSELFFVSVGAVVPHRHPKSGPWCSYLDVSNSPTNSEICTFKKRRFSGRLHKGPFVALRRTSSPTDACRLPMTVVSSGDFIAVENHLIVLQPIDGTLQSCKKLVSILQGPKATEWVNSAIRCRHLTKRVVSMLPIGDW